MMSPLDVLLDPSSLFVLGLYVLLFAAERLAPGRKLPQVRGWLTARLVALALFLMVSAYLPLLWTDLLAPLRIADLSAWSTWAAAGIGVFVYELIAYAYHRALHGFTPLWRCIHQMHHSSERLDVPSAFWFSPLDMVGWTLVPSLMLAFVGLPAQAATAAMLFITFLGIFQHANIRTPHWLGYLIQRPESHSVHHQRGQHRFNYADLPVVDMVFGTFRNPGGYVAETGFWQGASARVFDMLVARDVAAGAQRADDAASAHQAVVLGCSGDLEDRRQCRS